MKAPFLILPLAVALAACGTLAPDYARPASPVPAVWREAGTEPARLQAPEIGWRSVFKDANLQKVIELALQNNRDLRVAALNIEKARAEYRIARADLFPTVSVSAGQTATSAIASGSSNATVTRAYSVGLGFSAYELDLFGRLRSLKDQALESYLATAEAHDSSKISLIAEVATDYLTLAADQERLALAKRTLATQMETLELTQQRFAAGIDSEIDLNDVKSTTEAARVATATYSSQVALDRNALELVMGTPLPEQLVPSRAVVDGVSEIPIGVDSVALLKRPDIRELEHQLKGANANIGAARAAFFPSITLTASGGRGSDQLSTLFKAGSRTWSFEPQINIPIFNAGRLSADLDVAHVEKDIAVANYEKGIQTAFREVADALVQHATLSDKEKAEQALVESTRKSNTLSQARFTQGVDGYLPVLVSHRSLIAAQQDLIGIQLARATNLITLYKVLGGGLKEQDETLSQAPVK